MELMLGTMECAMLNSSTSCTSTDAHLWAAKALETTLPSDLLHVKRLLGFQKILLDADFSVAAAGVARRYWRYFILKRK